MPRYEKHFKVEAILPYVAEFIVNVQSYVVPATLTPVIFIPLKEVSSHEVILLFAQVGSEK